MRIIFLVIISLAVFFIPGNSVAEDPGVRIGPYVITYVQSFRSSDHGFTIEFDVIPDPGSEIPCLHETGGAYMPVYVAMKVNGLIKSGSISTFFSNERPCVSPYILYAFTEEEHAQIAGKKLEVIFSTPERPYYGQNLFGVGRVFFHSVRVR